jgi:hypothetical protein
LEIKISRHAKRRIKLYNIPEEKVIQIITEAQTSRGKQAIIKKIDGFSCPIKILFEVSDKKLIVITCYPLKRGV